MRGIEGKKTEQPQGFGLGDTEPHKSGVRTGSQRGAQPYLEKRR